jgi:predicted Zn-ribbon and HTH transcriptional regulator
VGLDEPASALVELADQRGGAFLVAPHQAAEAGYVDHEDGGELASRCGGLRHAKTMMTRFVEFDQT